MPRLRVKAAWQDFEVDRKRPVAYHHGDLRRALLVAVEGLLEEGGTDALTLREAARRVGVDHRAVYKHFADRDALLAEVAEGGYRVIEAEVRAELERVVPDDATARLLAIARVYVAFAVRRRGLYRLLSGRRLNEDGRFPAVGRAADAIQALVTSEIEAGMASGQLARGSAVEATVALFAGMHGLANLVIMRRVRVRALDSRELAAFTASVVGLTVRGMQRGGE
jgi:AcrR family transcriptional regulator